MKQNKLVLLILCVTFSFQLFGQKNGWYDTVYLYEFMYSKYYIAEREYYHNDKLLKKEKYKGNTFTENISGAEFYFYNNGVRGYGFKWDIHYDTFLLAVYRRYRDIRIIDSSYYLYKDKDGVENIGSVDFFTGYVNGKEVKREYAPGEFYLDYPVNPDTIPTFYRKLVGNRKED